MTKSMVFINCMSLVVCAGFLAEGISRGQSWKVGLAGLGVFFGVWSLVMS